MQEGQSRRDVGRHLPPAGVPATERERTPCGAAVAVRTEEAGGAAGCNAGGKRSARRCSGGAASGAESSVRSPREVALSRGILAGQRRRQVTALLQVGQAGGGRFRSELHARSAAGPLRPHAAACDDKRSKHVVAVPFWRASATSACQHPFQGQTGAHPHSLPCPSQRLPSPAARCCPPWPGLPLPCPTMNSVKTTALSACSATPTNCSIFLRAGGQMQGADEGHSL